MTQQFIADSGESIIIHPDTVSDLKALATLTREPEESLLAAAVESLRSARLRTATARPPSATPRRKAAQ